VAPQQPDLDTDLALLLERWTTTGRSPSAAGGVVQCDLRSNEVLTDGGGTDTEAGNAPTKPFGGLITLRPAPATVHGAMD
jgi:hypothetical protein